MGRSFGDLENGVVLAELGGHGDGPYCAEHGAGAALVLLGTYVIDAADSVPYPEKFVFKPGRENYESYLKEHVAAARAGGAKVGVSVISVELEHSLDFLKAAEDAGADYASLCAYSGMEMFVSKRLGMAICKEENCDLLEKWTGALAEGLNIPVIFKMGFAGLAATTAAIETIANAGIPIVHVCIGGSAAGSPGLQATDQLAAKCDFLIVGGGVTDVEDARRVLAAGAGAVSIASAAMQDPALCGSIQQQLRSQ